MIQGFVSFAITVHLTLSELINSAVTSASGAVIGLLNDDIEVITPDWLSEMAAHALRPEVGAVGARLWYPNDTLQHAGVILGIRRCRRACSSASQTWWERLFRQGKPHSVILRPDSGLSCREKRNL